MSPPSPSRFRFNDSAVSGGRGVDWVGGVLATDTELPLPPENICGDADGERDPAGVPVGTGEAADPLGLGGTVDSGGGGCGALTSAGKSATRSALTLGSSDSHAVIWAYDRTTPTRWHSLNASATAATYWGRLPASTLRHGSGATDMAV